MKVQMLCFLLMGLWILSCSDDGTDSGYDSGKPITINSFLPDSGGVRDKFVIKGENFGTDASRIKVYFNDMPAKVMNSSGRMIYALVPRQPGDNCEIKVVVGDANVADSVVYKDKLFKYIVQASVSTVVGKQDINGNGGYIDGEFAEAMFDDPRGVAVDKDGSILVTEVFPRRLRLAVDNKVSTVMANLPEYPCLLTMELNREVAYFPLNTGPYDVGIYRMERVKGYLPVEIIHLKKTEYPNFNYLCNVPVDEEKNLYVLGRPDGCIVRFSYPTYKMDTLGYIGRDAAGGYGVYNPNDKKMYWSMPSRHCIYRMNLDGSELELFAGKLGIPGTSNGLGESARFNSPAGICVDSRGLIYVCDSKNHVIRQIDQEGFVTTLAGKPGIAGYSDGAPDEAMFNEPTGIAVDLNDFLYVADKNNSRIRKIAVE